ncbi:putative ribonuclease H protein [Vitis vinifera]|uniref:Putative ribonuclease H protein n=1 Tax=Vitis vinifera TaxID=29760 RepID=A0A438GTS6_VITVI|nr:putative ribonuclease H protein [Vitis vinifera]
MPCYFLSLFKILASVAAKIERLQRDFLWSRVGEGKRDHLVSWDVVCKPKAKGGLGFGKIVLRNVALLGKWLWRYPREGSTLWHKMRDPGLYLLQGFLQSNLFFLPYPNALVLLQFSLLSVFGNLKSLSKSSPLSGWWHTKRGIVLWQDACIAVIWVVRRERKARIFEDKVRNSENLWDSIHFLASLWDFVPSKCWRTLPVGQGTNGIALFVMENVSKPEFRAES